MNTNLKAITAEHLHPIGRTLTSSEQPAKIDKRSFEALLQIPSNVGFITPVVERIVRKLQRSRCIPGKESAVRSALYEALANAVTHGNRQDAKKMVRVRCRYEADSCVSIIVSDEGHGFDPKMVPDPTRPENLEAEHGRGIFLMKAYMDEVRYEKGGTEVHLIKKCDGAVQTLFRSYAARLSHFMSGRGRKK